MQNFDTSLYITLPSIVADKMDSLKGATLIKADGSKVEAEKALENKVRCINVNPVLEILTRSDFKKARKYKKTFV